MAELGSSNIYGNLNLTNNDIVNVKNLYAGSFIKAGGLATQFLMADGSAKLFSATPALASLVTSTTAGGFTNVATGNTNTYLNVVQGGSSVGSSTQVTGAGSVTVSSDTAGKLTITGVNTNTTYSAGTGLTLTGTVFTPTFGTAAGTVAQGNHTHTFASLTSIPTTIAGYGITDAPTKTGTGASGTWGISVSGNAATATTATTTTGNAATATKLQTARTIGGVSFDGSANINLPGVNTTGNQSTTGNAASATKLATSRTITLSTAVSATATEFNGTANISIPVTGINASYLNSGTVPDARISGLYTGFSHRIDGSNTVFTSPSAGTHSSDGRTIFGLAEFKSNSSGLVGAIVFIAPFARATAIMKQIEINGMLYGTADIVRSIISNYTSGLTKQMSLGTYDIAVRVGTAPNGNFCIILGDVGTTWSYPHFVLSRAMLSHSGVSDSSAMGWTTTHVTSFTGYSSISAEIANSASTTSITGNAATATTATNVNRSVTGGNGMTGGGTLTANQVITLGTPGSITLSSTNSVTSTSHTHNFVPGGTTAQYIRGDGSLATFPSIPAGTVTSITAGNGMNFTTISSTGAVTLGTPGTLTAGTSNGVTSTSHTHSITTTATGAASTIVQTDSAGKITAVDFIGSSDEKLKKNIKSYQPKSINTEYKTFVFKEDPQQKQRVGVIAQELEKHHPEFISEDLAGMKSVSYIDLHSAEIAQLKAENKQLRDELELIKKHLGI